MNVIARGLVGTCLFATAALAQLGAVVTLPPVPAGPYEPITAGVTLLSSPAERAAGLNLVNIAGQNYTFGSIGAPDVVIVAQLQSSGQAAVEGSGTMEQLRVAGRTTWFSDFANVQSGRPYPLATHPVPLYVQMARMALLWPILGRPKIQQIRVGNTVWQGKPATCVLVNAALATSLPSGRSWFENEYCLNSAGELVLMSPKPGIDLLYDYSAPLHFAGHTIAGSVRVVEGSETVLQIQVTRVSPPGPADLETFRQIPPSRSDLFEPVFMNFHPVPRSNIATVVVVHFTVNTNGQVQELEIVPAGNPAAEDAARAFFAKLRFRPIPFQREVFAHLESH